MLLNQGSADKVTLLSIGKALSSLIFKLVQCMSLTVFHPHPLASNSGLLCTDK